MCALKSTWNPLATILIYVPVLREQWLISNFRKCAVKLDVCNQPNVPPHLGRVATLPSERVDDAGTYRCGVQWASGEEAVTYDGESWWNRMEMFTLWTSMSLHNRLPAYTALPKYHAWWRRWANSALHPFWAANEYLVAGLTVKAGSQARDGLLMPRTLVEGCRAADVQSLKNSFHHEALRYNFITSCPLYITIYVSAPLTAVARWRSDIVEEKWA